jgi:hypothetical protein
MKPRRLEVARHMQQERLAAQRSGLAIQTKSLLFSTRGCANETLRERVTLLRGYRCEDRQSPGSGNPERSAGLTAYAD